MLKIHFSTGTAWARQAIVDGTLQDDLLGLVEEYVMEHDGDFRKYDYMELLEEYTDEEMDELYLPINGGEFYIDMILAVEEVGTKEYFKGKKIKDLTEEEREYLERSISGDYRIDDDGMNKEDREEVIIDFEDGLSVAGWIVCTGDEVYYEFNNEAVIYDAGE